MIEQVWTVERAENDRRFSYELWARYCYQALAEGVANREAKRELGTFWRVKDASGRVVWAGSYLLNGDPRGAS